MAAWLINYFKGDHGKATQEELREREERIRILKTDKSVACQFKLERSEREKAKLQKENESIKAEKEKLEETVRKLQHEIW